MAWSQPSLLRLLLDSSVLEPSGLQVTEISLLPVRALGEQGVCSCVLGFSFSPLVRTDSRGPLWLGSGGARQGSVVIHLFISLFITFAANIFTIMLFCGLFAKCTVSQVCFKLAPSWKVA